MPRVRPVTSKLAVDVLYLREQTGLKATSCLQAAAAGLGHFEIAHGRRLIV